MIEARNVSFSVGKKELISDVSVSFAAAKLHLVIGPNGAGKSTLIKLLSRLLRSSQGSVTYDGTDIGMSTEAELAKYRAVLSQAIDVAFPLTVREVVMMGRYPHFKGRPGSNDEQIVNDLMELFEVTEFEHRNYQTLSGGERQRVNFARVLAQLWLPESHPPVSDHRYLFLDEPLTFLDINHQIAFMKTVRKFAGNTYVVTVGVVHDLNLAARFADQIVLMDEGRVITVGTPAEVLTIDNIKHVFKVDPVMIDVDGSGMHMVFD